MASDAGADLDGSGPGEDSRAAGASSSGLFGRGFLYVLVWSMQTLAATVISPVLVHLLRPAEFGLIAASIALYQLLIVVAVLGLDSAISLQRARDADEHAARRVLVAGCAIGLAVPLAALGTSALWGPALGFGNASAVLTATIVWTAPGACVQLVLALLLAEDRIRSFAVISALSAVGGQLLGLGLMLAVARTSTMYVTGNVVTYSIAVLVGLALVRPPPTGIFAWREVNVALRVGIPLALTGLAAFVLNAADRIVVQRVLGPAENGRYQIAYTVGSVTILLLGFIGRAWIPRFAAVTDVTVRARLLCHSRDEIYDLLLPATLGLTLAAPIVLKVVAPPEYGTTTLPVIVWLVALAAFPVNASGATGRALVAAGTTKPLAVATAAAAVVNLALNIVTVRPMGIAGSAAATVVAFMLQAVIMRRALAGLPWSWPPLRLIVRMGIVIAASGLSLLLPHTAAWNAAKFALALGCIPWLLLRFRKSQQQDRRSPPKHATRRRFASFHSG